MPDPRPEQLVAEMRRYVALLNDLIAEYEHEQPPPEPEPTAEEKARRHWGLPLAVLVGAVAVWVQSRYRSAIVAAGASTIAVATGWLISQAPGDGPDAAPGPTITQTSPSTPSPRPTGTATATADQSVERSNEPAAPDVESAGAETTLPLPGGDVTDVAPTEVTPPELPEEVAPTDNGRVDVKTPPRCLVVKVGDLPVHVCRR